MSLNHEQQLILKSKLDNSMQAIQAELRLHNPSHEQQHGGEGDGVITDVLNHDAIYISTLSGEHYKKRRLV